MTLELCAYACELTSFSQINHVLKYIMQQFAIGLTGLCFIFRHICCYYVFVVYCSFILRHIHCNAVWLEDETTE